MISLFRGHFSKDKNLYRAIKNILGFYPENIFLYKLAFRHRSVSKVTNGIRRNNERLEYLGDAVLSATVAHYLFKKYPTQDEGFLTEMRSKMVSRATLNKVGLRMGLHRMINVDSANNNGGFKSIDGDALEALIGAIFLDKGFDFTQKVILRRIVSLHMDVDEMEHKDWNFKSKIIDWGQKERKKVDFRVEKTIRQGSKRLYKVGVSVDGEVVATGIEHSIKSAEQLAAENAYKKYIEPLMQANYCKHASMIADMEAEEKIIGNAPTLEAANRLAENNVEYVTTVKREPKTEEEPKVDIEAKVEEEPESESEFDKLTKTENQ